MDTKQSLKLVDGKFIPSEARKVILDLISSKLNYHTMEAFSIKERSNGDVSYAERRIAELREARNCLEDIIKYASERKLNLKVESFIEITFIE